MARGRPSSLGSRRARSRGCRAAPRARGRASARRSRSRARSPRSRRRGPGGSASRHVVVADRLRLHEPDVDALRARRAGRPRPCTAARRGRCASGSTGGGAARSHSRSSTPSGTPAGVCRARAQGRAGHGDEEGAVASVMIRSFQSGCRALPRAGPGGHGSCSTWARMMRSTTSARITGPGEVVEAVEQSVDGERGDPVAHRAELEECRSRRRRRSELVLGLGGSRSKRRRACSTCRAAQPRWRRTRPGRSGSRVASGRPTEAVILGESRVCDQFVGDYRYCGASPPRVGSS